MICVLCVAAAMALPKFISRLPENIAFFNKHTQCGEALLCGPLSTDLVAQGPKFESSRIILCQECVFFVRRFASGILSRS